MRAAIARFDHDRRAGESVRVSRAVQTLVVLADDSLHGPGKAHGLEHLGTGARVGLDERGSSVSVRGVFDAALLRAPAAPRCMIAPYPPWHTGLPVLPESDPIRVQSPHQHRQIVSARLTMRDTDANHVLLLETRERHPGTA